MGCDIHPNFEKRVTREDGTQVWEKIPEHQYDGRRHYFLFGWLANVRNGYGFAGCDTGDGIKPLALPRGLPSDLAGGEPEPELNDDWSYNSPEYQRWEDWYEHNNYGDHSQSWLTGEEIMNGIKTVGGTRKRGVISLAQYATWDKRSQPDSWCGSIGGGNAVTIDDTAAKRFGKQMLNNLAGVTDEIERLNKCYVRRARKVPRERRPERSAWHHDAYVSEKYPLLPGEETVTERSWVHTSRIRPVKAKQRKKLLKYQNRLQTGKDFHVAIQWELPNYAIQKEFSYFTNEVKRLMALHGEIRMVFGFDS